MTCSVTSDLPASIIWLRDSQTVITSQDISIVSENSQNNPQMLLVTRSTIKFNPLQASHGYNYTCTSTIDILSNRSSVSQTHQVNVNSTYAWAPLLQYCDNIGVFFLL